MTPVALIADDLTGALDTAAPFAKHGLSTVVGLSPEAAAAALASGADVVAISTGSREGSDAEARARVMTAARILAVARPTIIFKKVDSRLKGHVEAETEAALEAFALSRVWVCPAIPDFGRIVADGKLQGFGVAEPIDVAERLGALAGMSQIADARSDAELAAALDRALTDEPPLLVGARGLANALAARLGRPEREDSSPLGRPVLVAVGSTDPITRAQTDTLRRVLPADAIIAAPNGAVPDMAAVGEITLVLATEGAAQEPGPAVAERFGRGVARLAERLRPGALVLSGGETAQATLRALGVSTVAVSGEALPGIARAHASIAGRPCTILTKSGGFGGPATLVDLLGPWEPAKAPLASISTDHPGAPL